MVCPNVIVWHWKLKNHEEWHALDRIYMLTKYSIPLLEHIGVSIA